MRDFSRGLSIVFHHEKRVLVGLNAVYQSVAKEINVQTCIARDHFFENDAGRQCGLGYGFDPYERLMDDSDAKSPLPTPGKSPKNLPTGCSSWSVRMRIWASRRTS